jgi:hypothetical protein
MAAKRPKRPKRKRPLKRLKRIPRIPATLVTVPVLAEPSLAVRCPETFPELCRRLNKWAKDWEDWGERVRLILNCVVDTCCTQCDPGDPDPVPAPPKPPFN